MGLNTREYHSPYSQTKKTIQKIFLGIICDMALIEWVCPWITCL